MPGRILVVDDVRPNVKLLAAKLTGEYFEVLTAFDGEEALMRARTESPDVILLDIMMPKMDGYEVCLRLKADPRTQHIPVVIVTALGDSIERVRGLESGADDFLTKPVRDATLFARVRSLIRFKMTMDEWRQRERTSAQLGVASRPDGEEDASAAHILVIGDNEVDNLNIHEALDRDGNHVIVVEDGAVGMDLATRQDFDLIVVCLTFEGGDGLRVSSQFRAYKRTRQTPILLIVEEQEIERVAKGLDLGVNDYLIKPIERSELLARARTQIRRRRYQQRLQTNFETNLSLAIIDSLTGLYNRRYLMSHIDGLVSRARETGKPLTVIVIDIDHFKGVNDTHGHAAGDRVLQELARRILDNVRSFDLVARLGGEEFVVVTPDTGEEIAIGVAERLRGRIADAGFAADDGDTLSVTASFGLATLNAADDRAEALIARADSALYAAKRKGRNQVVACPHGSPREAAVRD